MCLINRIQLGTPKPIRRLINGRPQRIHRGVDIAVQARQEVGRFLQTRFQPEAANSVVPLEQGLSVVDAVGEVLRVDAGEGVGGAGVAAYGEEFGVREGLEVGVDGQVGDGVVVDQVAFVPVVGDGFVAGGVLEIGVVAGD